MSNPATPSSVTLSETLSQEEIDAIRARVARCPKSWDPSSTRLGTSWSVYHNATPSNESILVQWTHYDENGEPTTPFEIGSVQCVLKVDTLGGVPVYEWGTALNESRLIQDLIDQEGWVVSECDAVFVSLEPRNS